MFLKSLVLRGFKSFAERTLLTFEPGISVVVGPNGSGKSNVVDAICWVLGEQGPAALRGGRMEDVIFAGSGTKPALGMAEVRLTIDNSAGLLPVEFSEVTISRTLFRSGASEYQLNGSSCRLLDIQELLSDAGVGREQHIIVGQGRLDEVLSVDPQQMRLIVEEAAGVGKHRRRKERALRKIASAEANLVHLGDLLAEVRRQLKPLEQQAEMAQRHHQLDQELRQVRLILDSRRLAEVISSLKPFDNDLQAQVSHMELELSRVDARLAECEARRQQTHALAARRREVEWRLTASSERLAALKRLADERVRALKAELSATNEAAGEAHIAELARQLDESRAERLVAMEAEAAQKESADMALHVLEKAREAAAVTRQALAEQREASAALAEEVHRLGSELASIEALSRSTELERARQVERLSEDERKLNDARERQVVTREAVSDLIAQQEVLRGRARSGQESLRRLEQRRSALLDEIRDAERQAAHARARKEVMSGKASAEAARLAVLNRPEGRLAILSNLVDLPGRRRRALEYFLGPLDAVLVAADRAAATEVLTEEASAEPLVVLVAEGSAAVVDGAEALLSGAQSADSRAMPALGDIYLAPSVQDAVSLAEKHRHAVFVTADGAVAAGGLVLRRPGVTTPFLEELELRLVALNSELRKLDDSLQSSRAGVEEARDDASRMEAQLALESERARLAELEAHSMQMRIAECREAIRLIDDSLAPLSDRRLSLTRELSEARAVKASSDAELDHLEVKHAAAIAGVDEATSEWDVCRMAKGQAAERTRLLDERLEALEARMSKAAQSLTGVSDKRAILAGAMDQASWVSEVADHARVAVTLWAGEAATVHQATLALVTEVEGQVAELKSERSVLAADLEERRSRATHQNLARSELQVKRRIMEAGIREEWQVVPEQLLARFDSGSEPGSEPAFLGDLEDGLEQLMQLDELSLEARKSRLERQLAGMGSVNPLAAREAEALGERASFLSSQIDDVQNSRRDLLKVVESVDEKIKDLFASAYADVSVEFERLFQVLFPRGKGALRLTDPDDLLGSGVEVEAGPTGRSLKRLSLLSGGERALSALAVLFAIFRARPSPFYILDEVEAALDDVNLHRFLELLREFRDSSQLLVVTHQKRTMEVADVLYGVSIRPDGVSKVISERLSELFPA
jgi:chromosome segregation protein